MKVKETKIKNLLEIDLEVFEDFRGQYVETYNKEYYFNKGIKLEFLQDDISVSSQNILRGIHGDNKTHKLISCLLGRFYLVIVDLREDSKTYKQYVSFTLSETNRKQVLVPPGCGVAHLALSEKIIFHYKQTTYYNPDIQFTYKWNDPQLNIWWPVKNPIVSLRDETGKYPEG